MLGGLVGWLSTYLLIQGAFAGYVNIIGKPWHGVFKHRPSVILIIAFGIFFITGVIGCIFIVLIYIFKVGLVYKDVFHHNHWKVGIRVAQLSIILICIAAIDMYIEWLIAEKKK